MTERDFRMIFLLSHTFTYRLYKTTPKIRYLCTHTGHVHLSWVSSPLSLIALLIYPTLCWLFMLNINGNICWPIFFNRTLKLLTHYFIIYYIFWNQISYSVYQLRVPVIVSLFQHFIQDLKLNWTFFLLFGYISIIIN